ncbi:MAG TPA: polyprenyl synthetase family protein, partial [Draconibacterium sp.]|nr:polyprenyl synthetase family protein [Draconibacterium sp.]
LRPVLLLLSYNMFSDSVQNAIPSALAIEIFHNFTLLHDDIMDKAEVRRNRLTVHKQFSENNAILSGDVMAFLSYQYLLECKSERLQEVLGLFTKTAIEVCEGQQFDMDFENRLNVVEKEYIEMIRLKTAVLLACGLKAGALLANTNNEVADQLYEFGLNLGLAFQLQDDLLDSFGNQKSFGKKIGGDILANKKTYLLIKALEKSTGNLNRELLDWLNKTNYNPADKISAVLKIYNQLNIKEFTEQKIDFYFQECRTIFQHLLVDNAKKQQLQEITNLMLNRAY